MDGGWAGEAASFTAHDYIVNISVGVVVVTDYHVPDYHPPPPPLPPPAQHFLSRDAVVIRPIVHHPLKMFLR